MSVGLGGALTPPKPDKQGEATREVEYGTHTLPKKFWTSGKPPLLKDEGWLARREAKRARHEKNQLAKADANMGKRR